MTKSFNLDGATETKLEVQPNCDGDVMWHNIENKILDVPISSSLSKKKAKLQ